MRKLRQGPESGSLLTPTVHVRSISPGLLSNGKADMLQLSLVYQRTKMNTILTIYADSVNITQKNRCPFEHKPGSSLMKFMRD